MKKGNFPDGFDVDMAPLRNFVRKLDTMFNESFKHLQKNFNHNSFPIDVKETENEIIVLAELPGVNRNQIKLEIVGNQLKIGVEDKRSFSEKNEEESYYRHEESFQNKERVISVPFDIPEKETKASFHNGLLKVTIPKKNSKRKFINIDE
ncbi:Hsp20/alpha crystallin family protein [Oceanobacillus sp. Castelsardo]|uniref:Hsp20/alpha crystallin family protein n=1 Tax=Oceanobacillus sp. Castelsardo TaxID=1851204 RepID=UPI000838E5C1|nr:Hsp20/alpha crystallin family protein [Oceanobacillus sp. Castelsardo]